MTPQRSQPKLLLFILFLTLSYTGKAHTNQSIDSATLIDNNYTISEVADKISNYNIKASLYISMGKTYNKTGAFAKAINSFYYALKITELQEDSSKLIPIYNLFAYSLNHLNRYNEAIVYSNKAEHLLSKYPDPEEQIVLQINLADYHCSINEMGLALSHLKNALKTANVSNNTNLKAELLESIGELYFQTDNLVTAAQYFRKALCLLEKQEEINPYKTTNLFFNIGNYYSKLNNKDSALYYYNKALFISEKNHFKDRTSNTLYELSKLYISNRDTAKAYDFLMQHINAQKILFHSTMSQQISQLHVSV